MQFKQRVVYLLSAFVIAIAFASPVRAQDEPEVIQMTAIDSITIRPVGV